MTIDIFSFGLGMLTMLLYITSLILIDYFRDRKNKKRSDIWMNHIKIVRYIDIDREGYTNEYV